jgi:carbamoyl-phosphate synthase large subunit
VDRFALCIEEICADLWLNLPFMPLDPSIRSVLIIGSGPIVIGQACEFDYSGSQAARSLREEGIEVILINSNPATIMTDPVTADRVYLMPLTIESLEHIISQHRLDAVLPTMGGQTALNLCKEADELGIWVQHNIRLIGVDIDAIERTENREEFRRLMLEIGIGVAPSRIANSFLEGKEAAEEIGFPLVIRPSYTLGGTGGAVIYRKEDFDRALNRGLDASPTHEVLIDKAVLGWKEYELELLRDSADNVCIICTIENMDPMGIHTGDSITVAPAMTLSDTAMQAMRDQAIRMMRSIGNFAGGCNVQFAMDPLTEDIIAIEINPRVSRSSALASKATGYPIAKIAAKLAVGYRLDELPNQITLSTSAFFEPALDYVIVKIPKWNFDKFPGADRSLGFQMKSVGEVMGIGRSFNEALQKACQSLEINRSGIGADGKGERRLEVIMNSLEHPSWERLFHLYDAFALGVPLKSVQKATRIDPWFLREIRSLVELEQRVKPLSLVQMDHGLMQDLKQNGFSDLQIACMVLDDVQEEQVRAHRKSLGLHRVWKMVDTCSAEFPAVTPYYYSCYDTENESAASDKPKVIVLGSGPNRIGQGIEFDYSCVHGLLAARESGFEAIMVNCNPETVSTDFNMADKLYFEPVFWEHLLDLLEHEKPVGVIVQLGGQTALKLAEKIDAHGYRIIGTSYQSMDLAEDRGRFSDLLKDLDIPYPRYGVAETAEEALQIAHEVGYPVLVRPSYVLGGQGMSIVINDEELEKAVVDLLRRIPGNRILIDHFLDRAMEAEADCISDGHEVMMCGIMEHIEPAGIHSGDSHAVLPPFGLSPLVVTQMEEYTRRLAMALQINGLMNVQFAIKNDVVYVIEANPRASRTVPFLAKAYAIPFVNMATKVMLGIQKVSDFDPKFKLDGWAIKEPVFSFSKFPNVNKELGPEMKSTGEAIRFINDLRDPYFRDLYKRKSMYLSR